MEDKYNLILTFSKIFSSLNKISNYIPDSAIPSSSVTQNNYINIKFNIIENYFYKCDYYSKLAKYYK